MADADAEADAGFKVLSMSFRDLPAVHELASALNTNLPYGLRTELARSAVDEARSLLKAGKKADAAAIAQRDVLRLERTRHTPIINATGVLLHTNLGRTPLHPEAADAARAVAVDYSNVEIDLHEGARGGRAAYLTQLIKHLTGAEAALVVNNCAAALLVALATLASGAEVPVSRGELIEIGGSYRLPELMQASSCQLVEVGTTNRTRAADYQKALTDGTAMILKVHPSNYQVTGFSEEASLDQLAAIASDAKVPLVHDLGSGLLTNTPSWLPSPPPAWVSNEPSVASSLEHADLTLFSGDKLIGGPQAGIIVGSSDLVGRIKAHPMSRALRIDGSTMAALTTTFELYADGRAAELPLWDMASRSYESLLARLEAMASGQIRAGVSTVGGGSAPGSTIDSPLLVLPSGDELWQQLLKAQRPVLARRDKGELIIDLRTVAPEDDAYLASLLER